MRERLNLPGKMATVGPQDRCDRCDHEARAHRPAWESEGNGVESWACRRRVGTDWVKDEFDHRREVGLFCPCDGYVVKPVSERR